MVDDPQRVELQVNVPMFTAERPGLVVVTDVDDNGALVIRVSRVDGEPFTLDGPLMRQDRDGRPYVSFVPLTT